MKSLFSLIFLFLFANSAYAANLCDTSCNLTITFPSGGSIEATEALTFTFGTGGVLDLGATGTINTAVQPASTVFSVGGTLALAAGESISFDAGGSLDLGVGGNLDYTNMFIDTTGDITIEATGLGMISILDMTITAGSLTINSNATIENSLSLSGDATFSGTGVLTVSNEGVLTTEISATSSINIIDNSAGVINGGNLTLTLTEVTIDGVLYQLGDTQLVDGENVASATDPDGKTGVVVFKDSGPVFIPDATEGSSGSISLLLVFNLFVIALMLRRYHNRIFSIR